MHCPLGPIALAANLQIDAVSHNAFIQEQSLGIHYNASNDLLDYVKDRSVFGYAAGFVKMPTRPGLGVEVDEEYLKERGRSDIAGATRSGATRTGRSLNGELRRRQGLMPVLELYLRLIASEEAPNKRTTIPKIFSELERSLRALPPALARSMNSELRSVFWSSDISWTGAKGILAIHR